MTRLFAILCGSLAVPAAQLCAQEQPSPCQADQNQTTLVKSKPEEKFTVSQQTLEFTKAIRTNILANPSTTTAGKPYVEKLPLLKNSRISMLPIPSGSFLMGSPKQEAGRSTTEGPQREIKIDAFWMGEVEITWDLYKAFMESQLPRNKDGSVNRDGNKTTGEKPQINGKVTIADAVSQPTPPFQVMHFNMADGEGYSPEFPACSMTHHAASKFCEWLSAQTGHYYRLPTEAEWEYACRAGTKTSYYFGNDPKELAQHAWFMENANVDLAYEFEYQKVGQKKANPWGLHDMYGNVAEWVLDAPTGDAYQPLKKGILNPITLNSDRYPRTVRGGSFMQAAKELRSASRQFSHKKWKINDPQRPKSIWYHTNARHVGFRVVRPVKVPSLERMHLLWNTGPGKP